ncbi:MAG: sugar ABC transporter permease [Anaerolineae bacterium]|nr:sugar ABC transporter permease [Anaerolineae bacterium]
MAGITSSSGGGYSLFSTRTGKTKRAKISRAARRESLVGYLFASPWLVSLLIFTAYPVLAALYYGFTRYNVLQPAVWVGLDNYRQMLFEDQLFWKSLYNTVYYALFSVPPGLALALYLALLLNQKVPGISFFRSMFFLPSIVPVVAASVVWAWILNPEFGLINDMLGRLGLYRPPWLTSPTWSKPAFILMSLWGIGQTTIIFLAGLQDVPVHLYEAAEIDGANGLRKFISVTIPLLTPTIFFNLVTGIIGAFQIFSQVYIISEGGPLWSTLFYVYYLWRRAFQFFNMGYASALALVLFVIILGLTLVVLMTSNKWVYYEAEQK